MNKKYSKKAIIFLLFFIGVIIFVGVSAYAASIHTYYGYAYEDGNFSNKVENGTTITACVYKSSSDRWYNQSTTVDNSLVDKNYQIVIQPDQDIYQDCPIYWYIGSENTTNDSVFKNINTNWPNNEPYFNLTINDIPQISDNTVRDGTTGDSFEFNVTVIDYIDSGAQLTVNVSWSHNGSSANQTLTNTAGDFFTGTVTLGHNTNNMTYRVWVNDSSGNPSNSILYSVNVTDNDKAVISDIIQTNPTTGSTFNFTCNVTDNIAVSNVYLNYYFTGAWINESMSYNSTSGNYYNNITVPIDATTLNYNITAKDSSNNWNETGAQTLSVTDDDAPTISLDNSDNAGNTGDSFDFNITVVDNVDTAGLLTVKVNWSHNGTTTNYTLTNSVGNYFTGAVTLGHSISNMTYTIYVNDSSSNLNSSSLISIEVTDNDDPSSNVNTILGYWKNSTNNPLLISATANDNIALKNVSLYYNYSSDNSSWNGWTLFDINTTPWIEINFLFTFPQGSGYYRFYTIAEDNASRTESAPGSYDELCGYDTIAPSTELYELSPYWSITDTIVLNTTQATDTLSGLTSVSFYYYVSTDNSTFSGPFLAYTDSSSPYSYSFNYSNFSGSGFYRFYSVGTDNVGNLESAPATNDTRSAYGIVTSVVNTISSYWYNSLSNPVTITVNATDLSSSINNVNLYYYYSSDNLTFYGPYLHSVNSTPWLSLTSVSFCFNFTNNTGYYRFYSVASDNYTNSEPAPTTPNYDENCAYDNTSPTVSISIPENNEYYNSMDTISGTCSDTNSGVGSVNITIYNISSSKYWNGTGWNTTVTWLSANMGGTYLTWSYDSSSVTWNNGSFYKINAVSIDNQTYTSTNDSNRFYFDLEKPSSSMNSFSSYWYTTTPLWINATATDTWSSVSNVTLYWYYSSNNQTWQGPYSNGTDSISPYSWNFTFSNGSGFYRFYSIAKDLAANTETVPVTNDTKCGYDNIAPTCTIEYSNSRTYYKNLDTVTIYANFTEATSGINPTTVQIAINYTGGTDLSATSMTKTDNTHWTYSLNVPSGTIYNGLFNVTIYALDNASNNLNPYPSYDNSKYIDNSIPLSYINQITPFNQTSSDNLTITVNASDSYGGLKNVSLYYYNSTNNFTWYGPYLVDTNSTPWLNSTNIIWYFNFTDKNGSGYYRFYSIASDNATNEESVPAYDSHCYFGLTNRAPNASTLVSPSDGSSTTSSSRTLDWAYGGDPDGDDEANATYAVLFEITDSTPDVFVNTSTNLSSYSVSCSTSGTYYWRIITYDNNSIGTLGPVWSFEKETSGGSSPGGGITPGGDSTGPTTPENVQCTSDNSDNTPSFTWDASTDSGSDIDGYYVKIDDGDEIEIGDVTSYIWDSELSDGTYTFYVRAKDTSDNYGENGSCSFTIDTSGGIENQDPIANAGGPYEALTYENITFDGSESYDPDSSSDEDIQNYTWDFDDGTFGYGKNPIHAYNESGLYNVSLTVTDNNGGTDTNITLVNITLDTDGDGWSDKIEESYNTDINNESDKPLDTNKDGVPDEDSADGKYSGDEDDDGDGIPDDIEEEFGSDPKNSSGVKKLPEIEGEEGKLYYILDTNGDGIYDRIYSPDNSKVKIEKISGSNKYKIDLDGDEKWDYKYDPASSELEAIIVDSSDEQPIVPTWLIIILLVAIIIILIIYAMFKTGYLYIEEEEPEKKKEKSKPIEKKQTSTKNKSSKNSQKSKSKKQSSKKTTTKKKKK